MLYLVGSSFEFRLGDCIFGRRFVVFFSFSRPMATQFPMRRYMCLVDTEFCKYLSITAEVKDINLYKPVIKQRMSLHGFTPNSQLLNVFRISSVTNYDLNRWRFMEIMSRTSFRPLRKSVAFTARVVMRLSIY